MSDALAEDWRTRAREHEVTLIQVDDTGPLLTVVVAADGSVRVQQQIGRDVFVRVTTDGPGGYRSERRQVPPGFNAVAVLPARGTP